LPTCHPTVGSRAALKWRAQTRIAFDCVGARLASFRCSGSNDWTRESGVWRNARVLQGAADER